MKPTNSGGQVPRPESFRLGSPESRAAARMFAENRQDKRKRIQFVTNVQLPWHGEDSDPENPENWPPGELHSGPWQDCGDVLVRFVYVPSGLSEDEKLSFLDGVSYTARALTV